MASLTRLYAKHKTPYKRWGVKQHLRPNKSTQTEETGSKRKLSAAFQTPIICDSIIPILITLF